nr:LysM peptidoglycan-binding domain-containing protein [Anaerolineaceae bacterium]
MSYKPEKRKRKNSIIPKWVLPIGLLAVIELFFSGTGIKIPAFEKINILPQKTSIPANELIKSDELIPNLFPIPGPEVFIQEPLPATHIPIGASFKVVTAAFDEQGVKRMDLWIDDQLISSQSSPFPEGVSPFYLTQDLQSTSKGTYSLVIRAYNQQGSLGESPVITLIVSDQMEPSTNKYQHYHVAESETLENIAQKTGIPLNEILVANPGLEQISNAGQTISIPFPNDIQSPGQKYELHNGINPIPNLAPIPLGKTPDGLVIPLRNPDPNSLPSLAQLPEPTGVKIQSANYKVVLNWRDNATDEQGYVIYRRRNPDQIIAQRVAQLPANTTTFTEKLSIPGSYEYAIETMGKLVELPPGTIPVKDELEMDSQAMSVETARSLPIFIEVKPSADCIDMGSLKVLYFQPINFTPTDAGIKKASVWYRVQDTYGRRTPPAQGSYPTIGNWSSYPPEILPFPPHLYLDAPQGSHFTFEITASGQRNINQAPENLGTTANSIWPSDLSDGGLEYLFKNNDFEFEGKLWSEDI